MSGLTGGLENLLGIDTTAGNSQLQQALQAIQGVQTPTAVPRMMEDNAVDYTLT